LITYMVLILRVWDC